MTLEGGKKGLIQEEACSPLHRKTDKKTQMGSRLLFGAMFWIE